MESLIAIRKFLRPQSISIDDRVFQLHYRVTSLILLSCSLLVSARQHFGDPIECNNKNRDISPHMLNSFCWMQPTFSIPDAWNKSVGIDVVYPGVEQWNPGTKRTFHAYYQWVSFVLLIQSALFYAPRYFWKSMEGGKVKSLVMSFHMPVPTHDKKVLITYLVSTWKHRRFYFAWYLLSQCLNCANVTGQMFVLDVFFGGEFLTFGWDVVRFSEWDWSLRYDPLIKVFPRLTKCRFYTTGTSGDVQTYDALCLLPINIIKEKIFIFLWFWFVGLAAISVLHLFYTLVTLVTHCCQDLGNEFLLRLLSKNMDPLHFQDICEGVRKRTSGVKELWEGSPSKEPLNVTRSNDLSFNILEREYA